MTQYSLKDWLLGITEWITMRRLRPRRLVKVVDCVWEGDGTSDRYIELGVDCDAAVVKRKLETWRVISMESSQATIEKEVCGTRIFIATGVSRIKFTLLDEDRMTGGTEHEFISISGSRKDQVLEELEMMGATWG